MKSITELASSVGYPMLVFMGQPYVSPELRRLVEAAVEQEREACAKVADVWSKRQDDVGGYISRNIRARSNT
jgi:hypothetical protein